MGRALSGVTGANVSVATAYVTDVTPEQDRAKRFGQMGAMFGIGFIVGPLLGGALGEWHLRAPFLAAAAMNGLNLLMALYMLPESRPRLQRGPWHDANRSGKTNGADGRREADETSGARAACGALAGTRLNPFSAFHRLEGKAGLAPLMGVYAIITLVSQVPATLWVLYGQDRFGWTALIAGASLASYGACHALAQAFAIGPLAATLIYTASQAVWPGMAWGIGGLIYLLVLPLLYNPRMAGLDAPRQP